MEWWPPLKERATRVLREFVDQLVDSAAGPMRSAERQFTATVMGEPPARVVVGPSRPIVVGPNHADGTPILVAPTISTMIVPPVRPAWDEQGWVEHRNGGKVIYEGDYQVRSRSGKVVRFRGRIVVREDRAVAFIADPPPEIKRHPKGPCFQLTTPPWFRVHWQRPATNVDDALLYVQRILAEVLQ